MIEGYITEVLQKAPQLKALGYFVASEVIKELCQGDDLDATILKMRPKIRVKKEASIRGKIARYPDVAFSKLFNDLVGVRFVVLLTDEIKTIQHVIESNSAWMFKKVRDFGEQAKNSPELFDYQSVHYVLTTAKDLTYSEQTIPKGTNCEVQIRTLLQHAYAELTHDNIYKPTQIVPPTAKRYVARSMALMEATDDLFCRTLEELKSANLLRNNLYDGLVGIYKNLFSVNLNRINVTLNLEVIETFIDVVPQNVLIEVHSFFSLNADYLEKISERMSQKFLFQQPVVLLIYFLVYQNEFVVKKRWNLMSLLEELRLIYSDLGIALADRQ